MVDSQFTVTIVSSPADKPVTQEKKRRHTSTRSNELGSVFVANTVIDETASFNLSTVVLHIYVPPTEDDFSIFGGIFTYVQ